MCKLLLHVNFANNSHYFCISGARLSQDWPQEPEAQQPEGRCQDRRTSSSPPGAGCRCGYGEHFAPYSDAEMDAVFDLLLARVEAILAKNVAYVGFTTRSDSGFDTEVAAWVTSRRAQQFAPAVTQLDGTLFKNRQDLEDFGFKVEILHQHQFAYNCRMLETKIHRAFHASHHRLWRKVGSGSYYLKEEDLQVWGARATRT
jgi:hypothetical protein